jgi:hypothetical protein
MKRTGLFFLVLLITTSLYAQNNGKVIASAETEENVYTVRNQQEFVEQYNWLVETPIHQDEQRRKEVTASLANWIAENPQLDIELDPKLIKFSETTPELLIIFMGGWAKYAIENDDYDNKLEGNMAGLESVIGFYERNGEYMDKDKNVEKLMKLQDKGKLKRRVEKKM